MRHQSRYLSSLHDQAENPFAVIVSDTRRVEAYAKSETRVSEWVKAPGPGHSPYFETSHTISLSKV